VWQDRFNELLNNKKPSQAKTNSLAVASATKEPLYVPQNQFAAAVSLPPAIARDSGKVTSKEVEDEEAIFEDRETGSLPVVKVPFMAPSAAWQAVSSVRNRSKPPKPLDAATRGTLEFIEPGQDVVLATIRLPGTDTPKSFSIPTKQPASPQPRQRVNNSNNNRHRKAVRSKDGPANYRSPHGGKKQGSGNTPPGPQRAPVHNSGGDWASRVSNTNA
jgi:hypothetical protein